MSAMAAIFLVFLNYMVAFITGLDQFCSAAGAKFESGPVVVLAAAHDEAEPCYALHISVVLLDIRNDCENAINVNNDIYKWNKQQCSKQQSLLPFSDIKEAKWS